MKDKNLTQTFTLALAMMATLAMGSAIVFGQDKTNQQSTTSSTEEQGNALVGVGKSLTCLPKLIV